MPCDTMRTKAGQTEAERKAEVRAGIRRLAKLLAENRVAVAISPTGAIAFSGWTDRDGISDVCAIRSLQASRSPELQRAIQAAEARSGRRANPQLIAAGVHSHDGGRTWHAGH